MEVYQVSKRLLTRRVRHSSSAHTETGGAAAPQSPSFRVYVDVSMFLKLREPTRINSVFYEMPIEIRLSVTPPHWPTFTKRYLRPINTPSCEGHFARIFL